jgi:hypothetical protein
LPVERQELLSGKSFLETVLRLYVSWLNPQLSLLWIHPLEPTMADLFFVASLRRRVNPLGLLVQLLISRDAATPQRKA